MKKTQRVNDFIFRLFPLSDSQGRYSRQREKSRARKRPIRLQDSLPRTLIGESGGVVLTFANFSPNLPFRERLNSAIQENENKVSKVAKINCRQIREIKY